MRSIVLNWKRNSWADAAFRPSDENLNQITEYLEVFEHLVETEGFREDDAWMLKAVYGEVPGSRKS